MEELKSRVSRYVFAVRAFRIVRSVAPREVVTRDFEQFRWLHIDSPDLGVFPRLSTTKEPDLVR